MTHLHILQVFFFGKHKMAPKLSPKKSVEGAVGGVTGATLLGIIYGFIISGRMSGIFVHPVWTFAIAKFYRSVVIYNRRSGCICNQEKL